MRYEDIIDLPHHTSPARARMSINQRAAQFAPFAALTGYDAILAETARQTEAEVFPDETEVAAVNEKLCWLRENLSNMPMIGIRLFAPDGQKEGGAYYEISGRVTKIDEYQQKIWLEQGIEVEFRRIINLFIL